MLPGSRSFDDQRDRFLDAVAARTSVDPTPRRTQDRATEVRRFSVSDPFANEPDTDWSLPANRAWLADLDILAPCALGGAITDDNVEVIAADVICGAANNQLAHEGLDNRLLGRGVLYCPDFVVNAGGVIQVADERLGFDFERAKRKTSDIYETTLEILELASSKDVTPTEAATHLAADRMAAAADNA